MSEYEIRITEFLRRGKPRHRAQIKGDGFNFRGPVVGWDSRTKATAAARALEDAIANKVRVSANRAMAKEVVTKRRAQRWAVAGWVVALALAVVVVL